MLVRGAIYHHADMTFYDGGQQNKYLVLLNNPGPNDPCCFVKVTSQPRGPATPGCLGQQALFHIPAKVEYFPKPSWVQLFEVYPYAKDSLSPTNGIKRCGNLSTKIIDQLVQCLNDWAMDDIPRHLHKYLQLSQSAEINKLAALFNKNRNR